MKRLIAVIAALLVAAPAYAARVAVVVDSENLTDETQYRGIQNAHINDRLSQFKRIMDILGVNYEVVPASVAKTTMCATGQITRNLGAAGAYLDNYDAVVHFGFYGARAGGARNQPGYNPDSLTLTRTNYVPTVPQAFIATGGLFPNGASMASQWADQSGGAGVCSTGTVGNVADIDGSAQSVNQEQSHYRVGSTATFAQNSYTAWAVLNSTQPAGGSRALIAHGVNAGTYNGYLVGGHNANWFDSTGVEASPDSVVMWERMMTHSAGAKPLVFAFVGGLYPCLDSTNTVSMTIPCEGDMAMMVAVLARLDSILSGDLLFQKQGTGPLRAAITIDGGFNRSGRRHPGGINPPDTTVLWATIDSLNTLPNLKITLGVDMDSAAYQTSEKTKWLALGNKIRFAPMTWVGVMDGDTATAGLGVTSYQRPVDVFGRHRSRIFLGDETGASKDTSLWAGLHSLFYKADSLFGRAYVSRVVQAPLDDWSPESMTINGKDKSTGRRDVDSLLLVFQRLKLKGLRIDAQRPEANALRNRANPLRMLGYIGEQTWLTEPTTGWKVKLLAHSGYSIAGGWTQISFREDSTAPLTAACAACGIAQTPNIVTRELNRFWRQTTQLKGRDNDLMGGPGLQTNRDAPGSGNGGCDRCGVYESYEDYLYGVYRGSILKMHVQDFGGGASDPPARNGWWIVKSIHNNFRAINELANRNVCELVFPDELNP